VSPGRTKGPDAAERQAAGEKLGDMPGFEEVPPPDGNDGAPAHGDDDAPAAAGNDDGAPGRRAPPQSAIDAAWKPMPAAWFDTSNTPPRRRWLLCTPNGEEGVMPLGKVGLLVAAGGTGKTYALLELAFAVVTGRTWFQHFTVSADAAGRRVLVVLGEEDESEIHRRMFAIAKAHGLSAEEGARAAALISVVALGELAPAPLLERDGQGTGEQIETRHLRALRALLTRDAGPDGWALVLVDPLSQFGGADAETDNHAATVLFQSLATLAQSHGGPSILVAHHTGKAAKAAGKPDARGSSAFESSSRWMATMQPDGKGGVLFEIVKNNYAAPMAEPLLLGRWLGSGVLRALTLAELAAVKAIDGGKADGKEAARDERERVAVERLVDELLEKIRTSAAPVTSRPQALGLVTGKGTRTNAALSQLLADGRVVKLEGSGGKHSYVAKAEDAP